MTDLIAESITEWFGERCPDTEKGCPCCDAWAQYDALLAERDAIAAAAFEAAAEAVPTDLFYAGDWQATDDVLGAIRALTPADALANLKAIEAKAEVRGIRIAAELARHGHHPRAILDLADEREKGTGHD